jgi:hypothetical protein
LRLDPRFEALNRELALATSAVCIGLTALRKADFATPGTYTQAFFNLTIGIERLGKLAYILDYCVSNSGKLPTNGELKGSFGHDIEKLVSACREIRSKFPNDDSLAAYPADAITEAAVACLSGFAKKTRYYNLDLLVGSGPGVERDPIAEWDKRVNQPILAKHYNPTRRDEDQRRADALGTLLNEFSFVNFVNEDGSQINDAPTMLRRTDEARVAQKWAYLYVARIVRFLALLLDDLHYESARQRLEFIPFVGDHMGMFRNSDAYLRSRKTWGPI